MVFFPVVYLVFVLVDAPILWFGLSSAHPKLIRLLAVLWVAACALPLAVVIPSVIVTPTNLVSFILAVVAGLIIAAAVVEFEQRGTYLAVAETFAPAAECALFWAVGPAMFRRDMAAIVVANLASFGIGELVRSTLEL